jgi:hypothetical protein
MNLTISLDEPLAARLRQEAAARQVTPEQAAAELLGQALDERARQAAWQHVNRRRAELIRKARDAGLTPEEGRELDQLQTAVDQSLAPQDQQLIEMAEELRRLAEGLPDAVCP